MPVFHLSTNVKDVPRSFISKVSKEVASLTHKEESRVMVIVNDDVKMSFGGTGESLI
jgi:phenylpyruvate tautomerase PptA (4-oxalocrotonate tautomerase family)